MGETTSDIVFINFQVQFTQFFKQNCNQKINGISRIKIRL